VTGSDLARLESSPQLEGFRARGIEVLLLPDQVDSFWVTAPIDFEGKPFKSVTQGAADLALIPLVEGEGGSEVEAPGTVTSFIAILKATLGEVVSDVRASERLTESAVCLVAPESGMDRQLERLLARAGQLPSATKPVLEINPRHDLIVALANLGDDEQTFREDVAHLLLDEARILDGELPADAKAFSQRLARVMRRSAS
jgi:molecular chaperone HtpG